MASKIDIHTTRLPPLLAALIRTAQGRTSRETYDERTLDTTRVERNVLNKPGHTES